IRHASVRARTVELKVRSSDFRTFVRSQRLAEPTDLTASLWKAAAELLDRRVPGNLLPLRLLGVGATGLVREGAVQGELFDDGWRAKQSALDKAVDEIRARYGSDAIRRGTGRR